MSIRRHRAGPRLYELVVRVPPRNVEDVVTWLVEQGAPGLEERPASRAVEVVWFGEQRDRLIRLGRAARKTFAGVRGAHVRVRASSEALAAWRSTWTEHLTPQRLTPRLIAVPATVPSPRLRRTERAVFLEPALAFGFGEHPSTRLAARAVEEICRRGGVERLLDVGAGSGILAFVGILSGAGRAVGVDIDIDAVRAARKNAARNGVASRCRFSTARVSNVRGPFDLVVANIRLSPLLALAPAIARAIAPGGSLVLSGVLVEECRELGARYREFGMRRLGLDAREREQGWGLVALRRAGLS